MARGLPVLDDAPGVPDVVARLGGRGERVHVNLGPVCNNNCVFCMEEDRELRYQVNSALTPERVRDLLRRNAGAEEVCFTSGEPTLVAQLPAYCGWARELGFGRISVMTNGRRLSQLPYAAHLVKAGMNAFYVSIHGHEAKLHESLVRTPGAFAQTVAGLDNVTRLKAWGVVLHTSTVVTKRNLPHVGTGAIYDFLRAHGVDQVVFNVMQATGRAHTHFDQLFPRYTEIAEQFGRLIRERAPQPVEAYLVDIPLCVTEGIPDRNRGYVERYVHFEVSDPARGPSDAAAARARATDDGAFLEVQRADLDAVERDKHSDCRRCKYDGVCEGVWRNYVARYGWDELRPVA